MNDMRMCGIGGIVGPMHGIDVQALLAALRHRGPDHQASFSPAAEVWLGAARLAISDPTPAGNQPMSTPDGDLTVVHNGEIYNAKTLRTELSARGHVFRSRCDTEVLLHGYREWGEDVVSHLDGMFAFALWDGRTRELLLARDPLGIKPLWLARRGQALAFASEVRALLRAGVVDRSIALSAVADFLATGSVSEPQSLLEGVWALPPGHRLVVKGEVITTERYWRCPESESELSADEGRQKVRAELDHAVASCLEADVPVGLLLSGGIDSAALGLIARPFRRLETFHVRTAAEPARRAAEIARSLEARHHEIHIPAPEAARAAAASLSAQDQPSVDGLNTFIVSRAIAQAGLKAALTGLGADELFLGYPLHRTYVRARQLRSAAAPLRPAAELAARLVAGDWRIEKLCTLVAAKGPAATYRAARALFPQTSARLLLPDAASAPPPEIVCSDPANEVSRFEISNYLVNTLLRDADIMSMAHGVELRVPLLERRVVETVLALPASIKLRRGAQKPLLSSAVPELPARLASARKVGFDLPLEQWLLGPLRSPVEETLLSSEVSRVALDRAAVARVWQRFQRRRDRSHANRVWALHSLVTWAHAHGASA